MYHIGTFYILGHPKSVDEFTYADSDINDVILACMSNIATIGLSGSMPLGQGADPIKNVKMERIQGKMVLKDYLTIKIFEPEHAICLITTI